MRYILQITFESNNWLSFSGLKSCMNCWKRETFCGREHSLPPFAPSSLHPRSCNAMPLTNTPEKKLSKTSKHQSTMCYPEDHINTTIGSHGESHIVQMFQW